MTKIGIGKGIALACVFVFSFGLALWTGPSSQGLGKAGAMVQRFSMPANHLLTVMVGRDKSPYFEDRPVLEAADLQEGLAALERDYSLLDPQDKPALREDFSTYRLSYVLPIAYKLQGGVQEVKLNKGSRHGLEPGMALVSAKGYLGHLTFVDKYFSYARLTTDPRQSLAVEAEDGRQGIARAKVYKQDLTLIQGDGEWPSGEKVFTQATEWHPGGLILGSYTWSGQGGSIQVSGNPLTDPIMFVLLGWSEPNFQEGDDKG